MKQKELTLLIWNHPLDYHHGSVKAHQAILKSNRYNFKCLQECYDPKIIEG